MPVWPDNKRFAFSILDDPDSQTLEGGREVYALLADCGLRTSKAVWPLAPSEPPSDHGATCADPAYVEWLRGLQRAGFEIAFHNATSHTSTRERTIQGLERFAALFGHYPRVYAQHYYCQESLYWGDSRLTGIHRTFYNALTAWRNRGKSFGHVAGHPNFWGDQCKEKIRYVRNFVFGDINTLKVCPWMPYHDPARPFVNYWFSSSEGSRVTTFNGQLREENQERLEAEGGACILYTHFGHGFYEHGKLDSRFRSLVELLAKRDGWFVPVSTLLDYLTREKRNGAIGPAERLELERRWLKHKIGFGTA
jgi:hypothetical protein